MPIITRASMIEYGRMSIRPRVWVIQCFQDFSKLLVRPQADEDKQGVLPCFSISALLCNISIQKQQKRLNSPEIFFLTVKTFRSKF
jgi:hypothetical protein